MNSYVVFSIYNYDQRFSTFYRPALRDYSNWLHDKKPGLDLSEPMLFDIGHGLGFIYWDMKSMDFPFIGGQIKPDMITDNLAKNLAKNLEVKVE